MKPARAPSVKLGSPKSDYADEVSPYTSPPAKPQTTIIDMRIAVFLGADYKFMELPAAQDLANNLQREIATLKKRIKRRERSQKKRDKANACAV